ncbi:unnamed protein product [Dracunculus medinensis]|uniref:ANK_REP_REGION domain-containing protein n=1 Tax=Dracunculus medinensis TaxID=318479 RepID=A0A0N4UED6_DRAME|nr:unnamed protein product [Dracunculus medinensis]
MRQKIYQLEKIANKIESREDHQELLSQIKEHHDEVERNRELLRQIVASLMKNIGYQSRNELFYGNENAKASELRTRTKQVDNMKKESAKVTENLSALVARMSDQLALSETTTSTLIHSSALLKGTEVEFSSMAAHIQSGGKLISKYGRKECTDKFLVALALFLYFVVIFYILHKRNFCIFTMKWTTLHHSLILFPLFLLLMALDVERTKLCNFLLENKAEEAKRILLQHNDLIFSKDDSGRAAIHWAATGGCLEIVQFCVSLDENAAADPDDSGWTPLMIACSAGRINVVKYLLNITVDVNVRNKNGQTPLHYAASKNYLQITSLLIENGADVNAQDKYLATPLHRAASQGHEKVFFDKIRLKSPKVSYSFLICDIIFYS